MIRSEVGVTAPALLLALAECVPGFTTCFEPLLTVRDGFCFFVIGQPFGSRRMDRSADHSKTWCTMPIVRFVSARPREQLQRCIEEVLPAFRS